MKLDVKTPMSRLGELTDDELRTFHVELTDALGQVPEENASSIGELGALQEASFSVRREYDRRDSAALAAPAAPAALAAPAAGGVIARMAARQGRPVPSPESGRSRGRRPAIVATAAMRDVDLDNGLQDRYGLARAMSSTLSRMSKDGPARGDVVLASARWHYPEDRTLTSDQDRNATLIDAVTSANALTATGGICLPVNVDYDVPTFSTQDRPLRDGLPAFEASRGGLRYVQPPDIAQWAAATGLWTEATDVSPGAATKPIVSLSCASEQLVYVEAVSTRIGFGNMQARFAPEQVAANTDVAMAAAARVAENNLLNLIAAACVQNVTTAQLLGAARDVLTTLAQAVAAYRNGHRIPDSQAITAIFPSWLRQLIKADLARETAHSQSSDWNSLMISDAQVDDLMATQGIKPIWHLDGQPSSVAGGVAQTFALQSTGPIQTFPSKLVFYLFAEGQFQFLDGGRLDLGVVRDSTLDATNDYETFVETFETVAFRGFASGAVQYVSTLCANGASSATIPPVTCA